MHYKILLNYKAKLFILPIIFFLLSLLFKRKNENENKIGVISLRHEVNIGNNLLKYAISIKLKELGFQPYIIGTLWKNYDISFLKKNTNCIIINNSFSEIHINDYNILMVNSDQTWRNIDKDFYDYGFLKFAKNWKIKKFVYGASLGFDNWRLTRNDEIVVKKLIKKFTGISLREKGSIKLVETHLGIKPIFVLDPTLLIDKKYYLNLIQSYKKKNYFPKNFILTYLVKKENITNTYIDIASKKLKYKIVNVNMKYKESIEKFIYGISKCKAVITNSFHGTIFSIIFKKPFISFIYKGSAKERLISLGDLLSIKDRIFNYDQIPEVGLLTKPLNVNYTLLKELKIKSINFLKKNLGII